MPRCASASSSPALRDRAIGEGRFSPAALADLTDIAIFIARDNPGRALTFVDELEGKCNALGTSPGTGTARPELGAGICMLPHGRYLIFYRQVSKALRIERVVHGARDIGGNDFGMADPSGP